MHEAHSLASCGLTDKMVADKGSSARHARLVFHDGACSKEHLMGWQVEKKAGGLKVMVINTVGYGKWKVRLKNGTVEDLSSRMLKKIRFIGESNGSNDDNKNVDDNENTGVDNNGEDEYDHNWDANEDNDEDSEDPGLELGDAQPTGGDDDNDLEVYADEPNDKFNDFAIGEEDMLDDTVLNVDREAPPSTKDKYAGKLLETLRKKRETYQ
jgi:hypothetical protein